jgi:CDP-glucose 4,6-dehydratase
MAIWKRTMEDLGIIMNQKINKHFWHGKRVFVTGHTGFKGSWMCLWLKSLGASISGFSLEPSTLPNLFTEAKVNEDMISNIGDVCDFKAVYSSMELHKPEIVIHMAAQPLVRPSYDEPVQTYATNVMGTVHVLEAVRQLGCVKVVINVTTDKCYENKEWPWGYRENEAMGGYDPYSSSKGCSELVTSAYRSSFFSNDNVAIASARAGNVIGGGDWTLDRLVPDILSSFQNCKPVMVRNPIATRPWQHVLEPLSGYLILAEMLYQHGSEFAEAWNFGPKDDNSRTVEWIVEKMCDQWGKGASWGLDSDSHPHEANFLKLDISKAKSRLGWQPKSSLEQTLCSVVNWHKNWLNKQSARDLCLEEIDSF